MSNVYVKGVNNFWGPISRPEFVTLARSGIISQKDYILNSFKHQWEKIENFHSLNTIFSPEFTYKKPKIIVVGGNKGGVGKTLFAASFSLALSKQSKSVLAVDTDFSDPDLNEWLNVKRPSKTLGHFFDRRVKNLDELVQKTNHPNLSIICGDAKTLHVSNPRFYHRSMLTNQLLQQNTDYIVLDQSPGISYSSVDFFLNADEQILVTIPEPSAILSVFRFLRISLFRKLKASFINNQIVLSKIKQYESPFWHQSYAPISTLRSKLQQIDYEAAAIFDGIIESIKPKIILNMIMDKRETNEGKLLCYAINQLLSIEPEFFGTIPYMVNLRKFTKEKKPLCLISQSEQLVVTDDTYDTQLEKQEKSPFPWRRKSNKASPPYFSIVKSVFDNMVPHWPQ